MAASKVTMHGGADIEKAIRDIAKKLGKAGTVRAGFLEGATNTDGQSIPMIAAIHNFGAPAAGIPPRPFFSQAISKGKQTWPKRVVKIAQAANYDGDLIMNRIGEMLRADIQQAIHDVKGRKLEDATAKRKGFPTLLIDTSEMLNSVDYEVEK